MTKPTRGQLAPIVYVLVFGAITTAVLALASLPVLVWLVDHPVALAGGMTALSRAVGYAVARLPHFGESERTLETKQTLVHDQVDSVIDRLAIVQAELDLMVTKIVQARAKLPDKGVI